MLSTKQIGVITGLVVGGIVTLKVTGSILGAINDIPFMQDLFELVGLVYTIKFVLDNIKAEDRSNTVKVLSDGLEELGVVETIKETVAVVVSKVQQYLPKDNSKTTVSNWETIETSVPQEEDIVVIDNDKKPI